MCACVRACVRECVHACTRARAHYRNRRDGPEGRPHCQYDTISVQDSTAVPSDCIQPRVLLPVSIFALYLGETQTKAQDCQSLEHFSQSERGSHLTIPCGEKNTEHYPSVVPRNLKQDGNETEHSQADSEQYLQNTRSLMTRSISCNQRGAG